MLKYLTRAMGALAPKSAYERELEGRRTAFNQQQQRIKANRERVRNALDSGDRHEALRLSQPGAAGGSDTEREQRLAAFCRLDDELLERIEREHAASVAGMAAIRAEEAATANRRVSVIFMHDSDAARYRQLAKADAFLAAHDFLRERIANGYALETELPQ